MTKPGIDLSPPKSGGTSKTLADEANWKAFVVAERRGLLHFANERHG